MKKALVLGTDSRIFLSVVRSLGRGGVQVHAAWYESGAPALRSRYLAQLHSVPPFHHKDAAWKNALVELMARERFDLVIPCTELEVTACQEHRTELEKAGRVYTLADEAYEILFSKIRTAERARSVGVRVPRELIVTDLGQRPEVLAQLGLPLVLKPHISLDRERTGALQPVRKAYSSEEVDRLLPAMLQGGPVVAQENFIGQGIGVELLLNGGEPLLAFQHVRVHEPLHGGPSSYRKGVAVTPSLLEAALKILRPLRYTGVAMAEFKVNTTTGDWVFLEINARFWGSLPLAIASGVDFPLALFQMLVEGRTSFPQRYGRGIHCRNLLRDLDWQRANLLADHRDPTLATRPLYKVLGDVCWNTLTLRERLDTFTLDDPRPALSELRQLARRFWGWLGKTCRRMGRRRVEGGGNHSPSTRPVEGGGNHSPSTLHPSDVV